MAYGVFALKWCSLKKKQKSVLAERDQSMGDSVDGMWIQFFKKMGGIFFMKSCLNHFIHIFPVQGAFEQHMFHTFDILFKRGLEAIGGKMGRTDKV